MLNLSAIKKTAEGFGRDLMGRNCRFFEELIKGFMILYYLFVWDTRITVAVEDKGEMCRTADLLMVIIKVDLLTRDDV